MKYYPWKDLYNKTIEAPFQHKIQEPWDPKYIKAPEKQGLDTKERYENIMRSDSYKTVFSDYYYYFNPEDPNDPQNQTFRILPCDHDKLQNGISKHSSISNSQSREKQAEENPVSQRIIDKQKSSATSYLPNSQLGQPQSIYKKIDGNSGDIKVMTNIESKFSKIKQLSNSTSANNILRQYRVSGASSYINNNNNAGIMNNSGLSSGGNKSLVGGSINSNNSTSTSNQNNSIRKSSSRPYIGGGN